MYRIDDGLFIDTSLITCAEYQLFLDDMRAQGKHCQPDHWISNQFPKTQGRTPILGVRPSDAFNFCEWLNTREAKIWRYRLPTQDEANTYPLSSIEYSQFGYWILPSPVSVARVWTPRKSEMGLVFALDKTRDRAFTLALARNDKDDLINLVNLSVDPYGMYSLTRTLALAREDNSGLAKVIDQIINRDLNQDYTSLTKFDLDITSIFNRLRNRVNKIGQSRSSEMTASRIQDINLVCDKNRPLDLSLANEFSLARTRCINRALSHRFDRNDLVRVQEMDLDLIISGFIDIALNILILKLRRTEKYVAFEGIRIIKERNLE
jgi:hypothetical protein